MCGTCTPEIELASSISGASNDLHPNVMHPHLAPTHLSSSLIGAAPGAPSTATALNLDLSNSSHTSSAVSSILDSMSSGVGVEHHGMPNTSMALIEGATVAHLGLVAGASPITGGAAPSLAASLSATHSAPHSHAGDLTPSPQEHRPLSNGSTELHNGDIVNNADIMNNGDMLNNNGDIVTGSDHTPTPSPPSTITHMSGSESYKLSLHTHFKSEPATVI